MCGCVEQREAARHQARAPVSKVPHDLLQPVDSVRDLVCSFEARIHCDLPSVVEGLGSKLLLAIKVPVNSTFLQPCRSHEVREGRAVIPFLIEDGSRLTDDFSPGLFTFPHVGTPIGGIQQPSGRSFYNTSDWMRPNGL